MEGAGTELAFRLGIAHYDPPPPETLEDLEALRAGDRSVCQPSAGLDRGRGRPHRRPRPRRRHQDRQHHPAPRLARPDLRRPGLPGRAPQARAGRRLGPVHAVGRRPHRRAGAAAHPPPAVRPVDRPGRPVDPRPRHHPHRRPGHLRGRRGHPSRGTGSTTTTARWSPRRPDRLRPLVPRDRAAAHPWGDEDSPARFVVAAETALERRLSVAIIDGIPRSGGCRPARPWSSRAIPAPTSTSCSTACSGSRSTARRSPSLGPGAVVGEMALLEGAAHGHPAGGHPLPHRRGRRRPARPRRPRGGGTGPPRAGRLTMATAVPRRRRCASAFKPSTWSCPCSGCGKAAAGRAHLRRHPRAPRHPLLAGGGRGPPSRWPSACA